MAKYGTVKYPGAKDFPVTRPEAKLLAAILVDELWPDLTKNFASYKGGELRRDEAIRVARLLIQSLKMKSFRSEQNRNYSGGMYVWRTDIPYFVWARRRFLYERRTGQKFPSPGCPPDYHVPAAA